MGVFRELVEKALTSDSKGNFLVCSIGVECDLASQLNTDYTATEDQDALGISYLLVELLHGSLALTHRVCVVVLDGVIVQETSRNDQRIILDERARLGNWVLNLDGVFLEYIKEPSLHELELVVVALDGLLEGREESLWDLLILGDLHDKGVVLEVVLLVNQYDVCVVPDAFSCGDTRDTATNDDNSFLAVRVRVLDQGAREHWSHVFCRCFATHI